MRRPGRGLRYSNLMGFVSGFDNLRGFGHLFLGYAKHITSNVSDELPIIAYLHKQLLEDLENDLRRIVAANIRRHNWVMRDGQLCATSDEEEAT